MRKGEFTPRENSKFIGIYRAKVVSTADPKSGGRIQVRVFGLHSQDEQEIPNTTLPWAVPALTPLGGSNDEGFFTIPNVDSIVWVFFDGGNHNIPIYFASAPNKDNWNTDADEDNVVMEVGARSLKLVNAAGAEILMDVDGTISIQATNIEIRSDGDIDIEAGGNITETAGGIHRTTAGRIEHN